MNEKEELIQSMIQELRRGTVVLCVLSQLSKPCYGYTLVKNLEELGIAVDTNTLYPLLRRLEKQKLLFSEWETEGNKPRKYYRRTLLGDEIYQSLSKQWRIMSAHMEEMLK